MIDCHVHIWPHGSGTSFPVEKTLEKYCEQAAAVGIEELAITEHLFRFVQAIPLLERAWTAEEPSPLLEDMHTYWRTHATADLDAYVTAVEMAKARGMPVLLGLEVDYYPALMDAVGELLSGYPFDVLLGSVHWLGSWRFDDLDSKLSMDVWDHVQLDEAYERYVAAVEELASSHVCDVLAHLDLIKVTARVPEDLSWVHNRLADAAFMNGMTVEVSSAGWRKPIAEQYPCSSLLELLAEKGVPVTTASDAHDPFVVGHGFDKLFRLLEGAGYTHENTFRRRSPLAVPLEAVPLEAASLEKR